MPRRIQRSRSRAVLDGRRLAATEAVALGMRIRTGRKRRRWSLRTLGDKVGLTPSRVSQIERGHGRGASLEVWFALAQALGIYLRVEFGRDPVQEPDDAGHLAIQELALRLGRETNRARLFELATKPTNPSLSIDVCLRDDAQRVLIIHECWNTFGNINESIRSTRRKVAEAGNLAVAIGNGRPYAVAAVWIVRDTRRNREIMGRYPEVFAAAFPGSSRQWVQALTRNEHVPPPDAGLVWCDVRATRLIAWRRP